MLKINAPSRDIMMGTEGKGTSNNSRKIAININADNTATRSELINMKFCLIFLSSKMINYQSTTLAINHCSLPINH